MGLFSKFLKNKDTKQGNKENNIEIRSTQFDIRQLFENNLKFLSQKKIDVNLIERQFVNLDKNRITHIVGNVDCPTGRIIVVDPLTYIFHEDFSIELEKELIRVHIR